MNRRSFLSLLGSGALGAAAHTLDLDRLLWVPGKKTIFLPPAPIKFTMMYALPPFAVDKETGIAVRVMNEWIQFHPNAFAMVMAPLAPSRPLMRSDLADVEAVVFERWLAASEFERGLLPSVILSPRRRAARSARKAHNLEVTGSNPVGATNILSRGRHGFDGD